MKIKSFERIKIMGELTEKYDKYYNYVSSLTPEWPKVMLLETTNYCNHSCVFCDHSKMTRPKGFIKESLAYRILEEAYEEGTKEVGFYMFGEPLLDQNLEKYISYAKKIGYSYTFITTNGFMLDEKRMISIVDSGIDSIKFSINGGNKNHYFFAHGMDCFEKVRDNLIRLSEYRKINNKNYKIYISSVLTKYTQNDELEIRKIFSSYVDDIDISNCHNQAGYISDEIEGILKIEGTPHSYFINNSCFYPFNRLHITYEGYLTLCCVDYQNYLVVEDLNHTSLKDAWNSKKFQDIRQKHINDRLEGTLCYNCLKNTVSNIKPISEEYAFLLNFNSEKQSGLVKSRVEKLLDSENKE